MNVLISLLITLYALQVLLGAFAFLLNYFPIFMQEIPLSNLMLPAFSKLFDSVNIPLAIISVMCCSIGVFSGYTGLESLVCVCIFVLISFIVNALISHYIVDKIDEGLAIEPCSSKVTLEYIDVFNEIAKYNRSLLATINEEEAYFEHQIKTSAASVSCVYETLNQYIALQNEESKELLDKKKHCDAAFKALETEALNIQTVFADFVSKLNYSSASIKYCANSQVLLDDINKSFSETFHKNHLAACADSFQKTNNIISKLNMLSLKYDTLRYIPPSYIDAVNLYSLRMQSALKSFEDFYKGHL
ncbi:MAG: hypothetical protein Ta2F_17340 [Termitinemataceae bacterium]|nr:MAG: hypothetical protein Ta2F_17340 [Termitinemataceae bacterium]